MKEIYFITLHSAIKDLDLPAACNLPSPLTLRCENKATPIHNMKWNPPSHPSWPVLIQIKGKDREYTQYIHIHMTHVMRHENI